MTLFNFLFSSIFSIPSSSCGLCAGAPIENNFRVNLGGAPSRAAQRALGAGLATVHNALPAGDWPRAGVYGFPLDGCCGALAQPNNAARAPSSWAQFWAQHR